MTNMLNYYVGQKPADPVPISVYDSQGRVKNLSAFTGFEIVMLGSDNEVLDTSGVELATSGASTGRFTLRWPTDRSLFTKAGDYLLQIQIHGANGSLDMTTAATIRVKKLGGIK